MMGRGWWQVDILWPGPIPVAIHKVNLHGFNNPCRTLFTWKLPMASPPLLIFGNYWFMIDWTLMIPHITQCILHTQVFLLDLLHVLTFKRAGRGIIWCIKSLLAFIVISLVVSSKNFCLDIKIIFIAEVVFVVDVSDKVIQGNGCSVNISSETINVLPKSHSLGTSFSSFRKVAHK